MITSSLELVNTVSLIAVFFWQELNKHQIAIVFDV
jgi:hypothetical protein